MICRTASLAFVFSSLVFAQTSGNERLLGLGDSIGEGVASADASYRTQPLSYLSVVAHQFGVPFPLPLIKSNPVGFIESTAGRYRIFPSVVASNIAVSGAKVSSALRERPDGLGDTETDLVIAPRTRSQVEIAETSNAEFVIYWLGANDVLGAVLAFDQLNGTQITPIPQFTADYDESLRRLVGAGKKVVVATVPSVTRIPFLLNNQELTDFTGSDWGLPDGSYTSEVAAVLLKLGLADATLLQNPDWVLDPTEYNIVLQQVLNLNDVIRAEAAKYGVPVADVYQLFEDTAMNPPVAGGVTLTTRINGGLFTLDSVHPSETAHAVLANLFIATMDSAYGLAIPQLTNDQLNTIALADPHIDHDGDGVVPGRPFAGFLETIGPALGQSGDRDDDPTVHPVANAADFLQAIQTLGIAGKPGQSAFDAAREALRLAFGTQRFAHP